MPGTEMHRNREDIRREIMRFARYHCRHRDFHPRSQQNPFFAPKKENDRAATLPFVK
jgi:hypothetical protein